MRLPLRWWEWMLAFVPALAGWLAPPLARTWLPRIPPLHVGGGDIMDVQAVLQRGFNLTSWTIAIFSLPVAIVFTRGQTPRVPIANTLIAAFCLVVANTFVAFAGCSLFVVARSL